VRKYVKREKRKILPVGANYWAFDCKFGATEDAAESLHLGEITKQMDVVAKAGGDSFYVEILARPAVRTPRDRTTYVEEDDEDFDDENLNEPDLEDEPLLDEEDLEENDLTDEDADDIEWDESK